MENLKHQLQLLEFDFFRNRTASTGQLISENSVSIILTILIIIASIGIVVKISRFLKYLKFMKTNPTFFFHQKNALLKESIMSKLIKTKTYTKQFTFNIWANINQYNYKRAQSKMIFCMVPPWSKNILKNISEEDVNKNQQPGVWFEPYSNNIRVTLLSNNNQKKQLESCLIYDVPINEWFLFSITLNNRGLDIYMNGKLVRTVVLSGDPIITQGNILVNYFGGFSGEIQKLQYSSKSFTPEQIQKIYNCGRITSLVFNWFTVDKCPVSKITNPTAANDKCSIKKFGDKLASNQKMWFLPKPFQIIDNNKIETCEIDWESRLDWNIDTVDRTTNSLGLDGPTIGRDISCSEVSKLLDNNELLLMYNQEKDQKYIAEKTSDLYTSGLNYKSRHI